MVELGALLVSEEETAPLVVPGAELEAPPFVDAELETALLDELDSLAGVGVFLNAEVM